MTETIEQMLYAVRHDVPHKRDEAETAILQKFKALEERCEALDDFLSHADYGGWNNWSEEYWRKGLM